MLFRTSTGLCVSVSCGVLRNIHSADIRKEEGLSPSSRTKEIVHPLSPLYTTGTALKPSWGLKFGSYV